MIVGGIVGLTGFHLYEPFRAATPWLIPAHIGCYVIHMLQEHFDIIAPRSRGVGGTAASAMSTAPTRRKAE